MKKLLSILLLCAPLLSARRSYMESWFTVNITKVITAEYRSGFICDDGNIRSDNNGSFSVVSFPLPGGRLVADAVGGFNSFIAVATDGTAYGNLNDNTTNWTQSDITAKINFATDSSGATFNGLSKVDAMADNYLFLKSDGSVWYAGADSLHLAHSSGGVGMRPIKISGALVFQKAVIGFFRIVGLTTAGDVYEWTRNSGSVAPVQKTIPRPAIDIWTNHYDYAGCLIPKATGSQTMGYPYVWGSQFGVWRGNASYSQPTDISGIWGITIPLKVVCANWNTTHAIDSIGHLLGIAYSQTNGELGNGVEFANQYNYATPYSWPLNDGENPSGSTMIQIGSASQWKSLQSNTWFCFYKWAQDSSGNWYSWGRNKAKVLGNSLINNQEASYPNALDLVVPTLQAPLTVTGKALNFTLPNIGAGSNQTISTSSTTLTATGHPALLINSANSMDTANYTPATWLWTKTSGPACTITSPGSKSTTITGMTTGTYTFNVLMTDNNGGTATGSMTVTATVTQATNFITTHGPKRILH